MLTWTSTYSPCHKYFTLKASKCTQHLLANEHFVNEPALPHVCNQQGKRVQQCRRILANTVENKRWDFCFAHLWWCHMDGYPIFWVSGECWHRLQLKYWMPIHYDTIEDNKKFHLLLSFLIRIALFFILSVEYICQKHYITSLASFE